jgi:3-oxoadipate enol-lactonase
MQARINGHLAEYRVDGETGPWLVLSHSLGCNIAMWDGQMAALAQHYRVLRYDTRGHGASEAVPGAYSLDQLADDAAALMDHLRIDRATWVGFSMGGMIGQVFALRYPSRLVALVLADTTSEHSATPQSIWDARIQTALRNGMDPLVQPAIDRWFTPEFRQAQPAAVQRVASWIRATPVDGWVGCCHAIAAVHTTPRLHEIACPALLMVGDRDIGTPLAAALLMQRHLVDATTVVIADAAHMTCVEQPQQFNRALRMFLDAGRTARAE